VNVTSFRRLAACVGLVGAGALGMLTGPAIAHRWDGHPSAPPQTGFGVHPITMTLGTAGSAPNSVSKSRPAGCDSNDSGPGGAYAGGTCNVEHITLNLIAPTYGGTANHTVAALMCNGKLAAPTSGGGGGDTYNGCDWANARGLASVGIVGSGAISLNASGNLDSTADDGQCSSDPDLCGPGTKPGIQIDAPSCVTNNAVGHEGEAFDGGLAAVTQGSCANTNRNATCPPNPSHLAEGYACIVALSEFDPVALTTDDHLGFRVVQMKPPIPVSSEAVANTIVSVPPTCNGGACPVGPSGSYGPIATGVDVKITGRRFACKTIQPDDLATPGQQGTCLVAHTAKTVLVKRITTQLLEPSATVLSQTAGLDGSYTITFDMPNVVGSGFGDSYRFVPHAPDCAFSQGPSVTNPDYPNTCQSPRLNASGIRLFQT
jgi:hypothetical protein